MKPKRRSPDPVKGAQERRRLLEHYARPSDSERDRLLVRALTGLPARVRADLQRVREQYPEALVGALTQIEAAAGQRAYAKTAGRDEERTARALDRARQGLRAALSGAFLSGPLSQVLAHAHAAVADEISRQRTRARHVEPAKRGNPAIGRPRLLLMLRDLGLSRDRADAALTNLLRRLLPRP